MSEFQGSFQTIFRNIIGIQLHRQKAEPKDILFAEDKQVKLILEKPVLVRWEVVQNHRD